LAAVEAMYTLLATASTPFVMRSEHDSVMPFPANAMAELLSMSVSSSFGTRFTKAFGALTCFHAPAVSQLRVVSSAGFDQKRTSYAVAGNTGIKTANAHTHKSANDKENLFFIPI
jgi:hypothetical protein